MNVGSSNNQIGGFSLPPVPGPVSSETAGVGMPPRPPSGKLGGASLAPIVDLKQKQVVSDFTKAAKLKFGDGFSNSRRSDGGEDVNPNTPRGFKLPPLGSKTTTGSKEQDMTGFVPSSERRAALLAKTRSEKSI